MELSDVESLVDEEVLRVDDTDGVADTVVERLFDTSCDGEEERDSVAVPLREAESLWLHDVLALSITDDVDVNVAEADVD